MQLYKYSMLLLMLNKTHLLLFSVQNVLNVYGAMVLFTFTCVSCFLIIKHYTEYSINEDTIKIQKFRNGSGFHNRNCNEVRMPVPGVAANYNRFEHLSMKLFSFRIVPDSFLYIVGSIFICVSPPYLQKCEQFCNLNVTYSISVFMNG